MNYKNVMNDSGHYYDGKQELMNKSNDCHNCLKMFKNLELDVYKHRNAYLEEKNEDNKELKRQCELVNKLVEENKYLREEMENMRKKTKSLEECYERELEKTTKLKLENDERRKEIKHITSKNVEYEKYLKKLDADCRSYVNIKFQLEKQLEVVTDSHSNLESTIREYKVLVGTPCFNWCVKNLSGYLDMKPNTAASPNLISPAIYMKGYRFKLRVYPIGIKCDTKINPIPVSVAILIEKGEADSQLVWPIPYKIILRLLDPNYESEFKFRYSKSQNKAAYLQPQKADRQLLELIECVMTHKQVANLKDDMLNLQLYLI